MLVEAGPAHTINAKFVSYLRWEEAGRHSFLAIAMADGTVIRIMHDPSMKGGINCHNIERDIIAACNG